MTPEMAVALVLALGTPKASAPQPPNIRAAEPQNITWKFTPSIAAAFSKITGKPLLIFVCKDACPPCKRLAKAFGDQRVKAAVSSGFVPLFVDGEKDRQFNISVYPALIVYDPAGNWMRERHGWGEGDSPATLLAWLKGPAQTALNNPGCRCLYDESRCTCGAACECLGPHWWRNPDDTEIVRACPPGN